MKRKSLNLVLFSIPLTALAGCSGGNDSTTPPTPPTVVAQEDTFGTVFGTAFRAAPHDTPIEPKDGDIIPVSLTAEPIEIK